MILPVHESIKRKKDFSYWNLELGTIIDKPVISENHEQFHK